MLQNVAIIGAGISGLTVGYALRQAGIETNIYERSESVSEFGAGITLSRNATSLLEKLGILDDLKNQSYTPQKLYVRGYKTAKKITSTNFSGLICSDRRDVVTVLSDKYLDLGGNLNFSHDVKDVDIEGGRIFFSDDSMIKADLILVCDGIRSILREKYFDDSKPKFTNYVAWRGMLDLQKVPEFEGNHQVNLYYGPKSHVVHYPIGHEGKMNFVAIQASSEWKEESWREEGDHEYFLKVFKDWNRNLIKIFAASEKVYRWGVFDREQPTLLYKGKVVLLGDAAHPMVPFLGQGGCISIEDSYTLAYLIRELNGDIGKVLKYYQDLRLRRGHWIQKRSNFQGKFNHVVNPLGVAIRNFFTRIFANSNLENIHSYDAHKQSEVKIKLGVK
tara:strand:- start:2172 stop:3338 length:1167 start_codon:yes stop_codon:yes gene_type:complete